MKYYQTVVICSIVLKFATVVSPCKSSFVLCKHKFFLLLQGFLNQVHTTVYSLRALVCFIHASSVISIIIIIIIITTMFMVLSSWQSHCESSPGSFDECRMAPSGRRPKTMPDDLGCESACTGCQKLHPPSPFIITQPES